MNIGVVGPPDATAVEQAVETIESIAGKAHVGDLESVIASEPECIVAVGESAVFDLVQASVDVPLLPVAAGTGIRSVRERDGESAVRSLFEEYHVVDYPCLSVTVSDELVGTALFDATLVTTEPAQISEFSVATGETSVAHFRADGVVVATPAGSQGYARSVDGPVVDPGLEAAVVAPIAPFAIDLDTWVLDLHTQIRLGIERNEVSVSLQVDGRLVQTIDQTDTVEMSLDGTVPVAVVPESRPVYPD